MKRPLYLHEELLLLALRREEGTLHPGVSCEMGLGGAIFSELTLRGRIEVKDSRWSKKVLVCRSEPIGDPLLDECLEMIRKGRAAQAPEYWIMRFACIRELRHRVAASLCDKGILREEQGLFLLFFSRRIYPTTDPRRRQTLTERLSRAIFTDTEDFEARTVVLLSLAEQIHVLRHHFDKRRLKDRKERIQKLVKGELLSEELRRATESAAAIQVALQCTATIPMAVYSG